MYSNRTMVITAAAGGIIGYWLLNRIKKNAPPLSSNKNTAENEFRDKSSSVTSNIKDSAVSLKDKVDKGIKGMQDKAGGSTTPYKGIKD